MTTQPANDLTWHHRMSPSAITTMHDEPQTPATSSSSEDLGRLLLRQRMFPEETPLSRIGRYTVLRFLGAGGMGQVFVAYDPDLDRRVALKLLSPASTRVPEAEARLLREAQALAKLSHANVVQVYEVGQAKGQVYLAMEYIEGQTLRAWLEECEQAQLEILDKFTQAGRGLAAAHAAGLIHRDVTPANVLIDGEGFARVLDFGLVAATDVTASEDGDETLPPHTRPRHSAPVLVPVDAPLDLQLTHTGALLGTPNYMSPEQLRGDPLDARSDQFSFCVALHEALTGERPFAGATIIELTTNVIDGHRHELPAFRALPRRIREALERGLAVDPSQRWPSMHALLDALAPPSRTKLTLAVAAVAVPLLALGTWQLVEHYERELDASAVQLEVSAREGAAESERAEQATDEREAISHLRAAEEIELLARSPGHELEAIARGVELAGANAGLLPPAALRGLNLAMLGRVPLARLDSAARPLADAAFTPDGTRLVTIPLAASGNDNVEVWATQPPALLHSFALDGLELRSPQPQISPDGAHVALSSWRRCVVFELESGARVRELRGCTSPLWSPDGATLYGEVPCDDQGELEAPRSTCAVAAWELDGGARRWTRNMLGREGTLAVHPDGELLVLRHDHSANEAVELLRARDGKREALLDRPGRGRTKNYPINDAHMALSGDGSTLALIEHDDEGRIVTWDLAAREAKVIDSVSLTTWGGYFAKLELSADGQSLMLDGHGAGLTVFDLLRERFNFAQPWGDSSASRLPAGWLGISEGEWVQLPGPFHRQAATSAKQLVASADGRLAVSVSREGSRLWSLEAQLETQLGSLSAGERALGFNDEGLVSQPRLGGVRLYPRQADGSFAAAPSISDDHHGRTQPMSVASDRPTRMVFRGDELDAVYELGEAAPLCELPGAGNDWELDPSGARVVAVVGERAQVWEVEGCRELERFALPRRGMSVQSVARSGAVHLRGELGFNYVYTGEGHGQEIDAGCERERLTYFHLAPDARTLLTNCDGRLSEYVPAKLWDTSNGALLHEIDLRGYSGIARFTPDSSALLVRSGLDEFAVVDIESGRERLRVPGRLPPQSHWVPGGDANTLEYLRFGSEHVRVPLNVEALHDAACVTLSRAHPREGSEDTLALCQ